jgi:hypothetical protein
VIGNPSTKENDKRVMSSWSDDFEEALFIAGFKHFVLFDGGRWIEENNSARWG